MLSILSILGRLAQSIVIGTPFCYERFSGMHNFVCWSKVVEMNPFS